MSKMFSEKEFNDMWDELLYTSFGAQVSILERAIEKIATAQMPTTMFEEPIEILKDLVREVNEEAEHELKQMPTVKDEV